MSYLSTRMSYGREERFLDLPRFVADVCKAMGGRLIPNKMDDPDPRWTSFALDGLELGFSKGWRSNELERVTVRAAPLDSKLAYGDVPSSAEYRLPEAGMSTTKPIATIVRDIRRRVIEPAAAPIAKRRELAGVIAGRKAGLAERATWLRGLGLDVRLSEGSSYSGTFYRSDPHMSGTFYADGTVSLERMGSIDAGRFERLIGVLNGGNT